MKEIKTIDELLGVVDVRASKENIDQCLHYAYNNLIECITFDVVLDTASAVINIYNIGMTPSQDKLIDGTWHDYSAWWSLFLTESVNMNEVHIMSDEGKMVEFFDKLRMMVL